MIPNFERFLKVLRREGEPDRVPFYEHLVDPLIMEAVLSEPAPVHSITSRASKEAYIKYLIRFFNGLGYDCLPIEIGMNLFRVNVETSHREEPLGKTSRGWNDNMHATIANMEEFEEYPFPEPESAVDYELLELARALLPDGMKLVAGVAGGVHEHVLALVGIRQLSIAMHREPAFVKAMFDKFGNLIATIDETIAAMDHVGALRMGDDMGYKTATLLSPKALREFAFPWHKRIAAIAHENDKPFILHSCGNLSEIIDDLIGDVGIDAWHSFQDIVLPVSKAKELHGDRVALLGGIDVDVLARGTVPDVVDYTRDVLQACMPGGGYALGSGSSVTNYMPVDNYRAMLETGLKYGKYT